MGFLFMNTEQEFRKQFGINLRKLRISYGFTQAELARDIGVPPAYISHVECGRRAPSAFNMYKIMRWFDDVDAWASLLGLL